MSSAATTSLPSEEIAQDYKDNLDDLMTNDRYQIANLTAIAKENIEHAEAIARVLALHIKKAPPTRKLPALYVLDSLIKNIGSPYTIYFGRNLHETFMLAYSQVDPSLRRKLEELLKTWREPVPGSLQTAPVLPLQTTQSIVDALNRFRATTTPARPQQYPTQLQPQPQAHAPGIIHGGQPYRATPTPPQQHSYVQPAINIPRPAPAPTPQPQYHQLPQQSMNLVSPPEPAQYNQSQPSYLPPPPPLLPPQPQYSYQQPIVQHQEPQSGRYDMPSGVDVRKLHADIEDLTTDAKIDCATHPMDQKAQIKLQTLQTLKEILDNSNPSHEDVRDIRTTITQQMNKRDAEKAALRQTPVSVPQPPYYQPVQAPLHPPTNYYQQLQPHHPAMVPQTQYSAPAPAPPSTPSFLNSTNLAELLRATAKPSLQPSAQAIATPQPQAMGHMNPIGDLSIFAQLRASGLLGNTATPPQGRTPPLPLAYLSVEDVPFNSAAMKTPRPHLVLKYMQEKPNQCGQCGKRFTSDDTGRLKKEKHLDWHFKTKQRGIEAEQRGQNRSWYVDEREWISSKESEDDLGLGDANGTATGGASAEVKKKQEDIVRAPSDPAIRNLPCPIDQEPFKSEWSAEIQDFVWRDAVKVGDRYYHASCFREMTRGRDVMKELNGRSTPVPLDNGTGHGHKRIATPDSVLGKRKAEDDEPTSSSKSRVKLEA